MFRCKIEIKIFTTIFPVMVNSYSFLKFELCGREKYNLVHNLLLFDWIAFVPLLPIVVGKCDFKFSVIITLRHCILVN